MRRIIIRISIFICCIGLQAQEVRVDLPCIGTTKTRLNIRTGPSVYYNKITTLPAGTEVTVVERRNEEWVKVEWDGKSGYANMKYMTYTPVAKPRTATKNKGSSSWDFSLWGIIVFCLKAYLTIIVIAAAIWLLKVVLKGVAVAFVIAAAVFYMTSWPFWWLNSLQRKLSRPWAWFLKRLDGRKKQGADARMALGAGATALHTPDTGEICLRSLLQPGAAPGVRGYQYDCGDDYPEQRQRWRRHLVAMASDDSGENSEVPRHPSPALRHRECDMDGD
jgi:hypothetical protein